MQHRTNKRTHSTRMLVHANVSETARANTRDERVDLIQSSSLTRRVDSLASSAKRSFKSRPRLAAAFFSFSSVSCRARGLRELSSSRSLNTARLIADGLDGVIIDVRHLLLRSHHRDFNIFGAGFHDLGASEVSEQAEASWRTSSSAWMASVMHDFSSLFSFDQCFSRISRTVLELRPIALACAPTHWLRWP